MWVFVELCLAMLLLPFVLGFFHTQMRHSTINSSLVYYRYFVCINVIFAGLIVASRVFLESQQVPEVDSNIYDFYAIALLSMVIAALVTLFSNHQLMFASAVIWIVFILSSSILHLVLIRMHEDGDPTLAWVHVGYNIIVVMILSGLMLRVKQAITE